MFTPQYTSIKSCYPLILVKEPKYLLQQECLQDSEVLYDLASGSWLVWANSTRVHDANGDMLLFNL